MKCRISKKEFLERLRAVLKIWDEPILRFGKEGLNIVEVDPAHVMMINTTIPAQDWEIYDIDNRDFAINLELFVNVLKKLRDPFIELNIDDIGITINDKIRINEIEANKEKRKIPKLTYDFEFSIERDKLKELIDTSALYTDNLKFLVEEDKVYAISENDIIQMREEIGKVKLLTDAKGKGTYSIDYLQNTIVMKGDTVDIWFGVDKPIKIEYADKNTYYLIAPRLKE